MKKAEELAREYAYEQSNEGITNSFTRRELADAFLTGYLAALSSQTDKVQSLLYDLKKPLRKMIEDNCNCGFDEQIGEGYQGGMCYEHEMLLRIEAYQTDEGEGA